MDLMEAKCLNCDQIGDHARGCTDPRRYLAISPSDFCVASCILLSEVNLMWIVGSGIRTKELGAKRLYYSSNRFLHASMRTLVETTTIWLLKESKHAS